MAELRKVVKIDEDKCDGCGVCVPSCAEGAIQIIDGKARLVSEVYCDGLGACLGECPQDAITIEERQADEFDQDAVERHLEDLEKQKHVKFNTDRSIQRPKAMGGCPGSLSRMFEPEEGLNKRQAEDSAGDINSRLRNWPVQLNLAPTKAPYFDGASLLISADCVPFAFADFHRKFLGGKTLLVGCPKLDDAEHYKEKLSRIFQQNDLREVEVLIMEVPCCSGLVHIVRMAAEEAETNVPLTFTTISLRGEVLDKRVLTPGTV
ncbi:ATP-binding protein [Gemmatimonadota bacterium]